MRRAYLSVCLLAALAVLPGAAQGKPPTKIAALGLTGLLNIDGIQHNAAFGPAVDSVNGNSGAVEKPIETDADAPRSEPRAFPVR
ncbi:hypothetical protein JQ615_09790 [Bradyrhizobium jicamae]|uniref:Uncharacterized protein n=1 Tax=Bradyrhizobium jicamae TaxID=280332 RepID=A0ABS5FFW8_9BRAD|nr:hypothetical protein [Bradyrhizobium jicamae]MBR0795678.1 hypothetical protein [Bradyrhizobium jicamae]MBR0933701.1 hypothetical protein [Bradyrhizobium jicamae]